MRRVVVESPFRGRTDAEALLNKEYLRQAMRDSFSRGEAPFASHRLYTDCLYDNIGYERQLGIEAGLVWGALADLTAVYEDLGISEGMQRGIDRAAREGRPIEHRSLFGWRKEKGEADASPVSHPASAAR